MGQQGSKSGSNASFDQIKSVSTSPDNRKKNSTDILTLSTNNSVQFAENLLLCWLDASSDKVNDANKRTIGNFQRAVNTVQTFTDLERCFAFLQSITDIEIVFVVSGSFGPQIVPRIVDFERIISIYIFCGNKANHIEWTKPYKKIKGIHTQIKDLTDSLRYDANKYDKSLTAFSILPPGPITVLNAANRNFLYLQILKSLILETTYDKKFRQDFMTYSRDFYSGNEYQLRIINTFEENYQLHAPIWWYTRKCFLYYMLRYAFAKVNYEIIYKFAFFIRDLHRDIKKSYLQTHHHQYSPINVYRSAKITPQQYQNLEQNNDGLLSFDDFVLTTLERSTALKFAQKLREDVHSVAILFKITIDPSKSSIPFIALNNLDYISDAESDIFLSMNTIFRINLIEKLFDRLYEVTLTPVTAKDEQIVQLVSFMQNVTQGSSSWYKMSRFMIEVEEYNQAENIFKHILNQIDDNQCEQRIFLHHELGYVCDLKNDPTNAIQYYQQAINLAEKYLSPNHRSLFSTYLNLANVLQKQGNLNKAYDQCQLALNLLSETNEPNILLAYNTKALIYQQQKNYREAQKTLEQAIDICRKDFPSAYSILADMYHNTANIYYNKQDYSKAMKYYERAVKTDEKFVPINHSALASTYFNLATACQHLNDYQNAIDYAQKSVDTARFIYGNDHKETKENLRYLQQLESQTSSVEVALL